MQKLTTGGDVDPNEWYVKHESRHIQAVQTLELVS